MSGRPSEHVAVLRAIAIDFFSDDVLGQFGAEREAINAAITALTAAGNDAQDAASSGAVDDTQRCASCGRGSRVGQPMAHFTTCTRAAIASTKDGRDE